MRLAAPARRDRAFSRAESRSSRPAGFPLSSVQGRLALHPGAVGSADLGEQVVLVGQPDEQGRHAQLRPRGSAKRLAVVARWRRGPPRGSSAPGAAGRRAPGSSRIPLSPTTPVLRTSPVGSVVRPRSWSMPATRTSATSLGAQAEVLRHRRTQLGHPTAVPDEVRGLRLDRRDQHVEGPLVPLELLGVLPVGPLRHQERGKDEEDAGPTQPREPPQHDHDEGDDAVAEVRRPGRGEDPPDLLAHRDSPRRGGPRRRRAPGSRRTARRPPSGAGGR